MSPKDSFFAAEELDLRWIDGRHWRVITHLFRYPYKSLEVVVPFGFTTDFASIPRVLWNILPPAGNYGKAAVLHDYLYQTGRWMEDGERCSRADADAVLLAAMEDCDVGVWTRRAIYAGVRVGGFLAWNAYRKVAA